MIVQEITESPETSVALENNKHIQLPEHDIRKVMMLALSVRNDLRTSKRSMQRASLLLSIEKMNVMIQEIEALLEKKEIDTYQLNSFKFIVSQRLLISPNEQFLLTQLESDILHHLCEKMDLLIHRDEILKKIWGHSDFYTSRSLDVYIHRLRKYFSIDSKIKLETVHRKGFKFSID